MHPLLDSSTKKKDYFGNNNRNLDSVHKDYETICRILPTVVPYQTL
jgi:hypothetical protein